MGQRKEIKDSYLFTTIITHMGIHVRIPPHDVPSQLRSGDVLHRVPHKYCAKGLPCSHCHAATA